MGLRICCLNSTLSAALRELGHDVLDLHPRPGLFELLPEIEKAGFTPEMVFQQEKLGPRVIVSDLWGLDCPRVYWSVDTHLNSFWHRYYGRLFDLVLTTQKDWVSPLERLGLPKVDWLPWYGSSRPFMAFSERDHQAAFVGRVTPHRIMRQWFTTFLRQNYPVTLAQEVSYERMLDLYDRSRVVPNESIFGEVNFRAFEAASCGSAVINPDLGEAIEGLFRGGEEHLVYSDVLELGDHLDRLLDNPAFAERLGRAARERVLRDHLPVHRARRLLELSEGLPRATGGEHDALLLTLHGLALRGEQLISPERLERSLADAPATPETLSALAQLRSEERSADRVMALVLPILDRRQYDWDLSVNSCCSAACLGVGEWNPAVQFWYRHGLGGRGVPERPQSPLELYLLWARELAREGRMYRPGLLFTPGRHLPETSLEFLLLAHDLAPEDPRVLRRIDALAMGVKGVEPLRMKLLTRLSRQGKEDWRLLTELSLVSFRAFRRNEGIETLRIAFDKARQRGMEAPFVSLLMSREPSGRALRALKGIIARDGGRAHA